MIGFYNYTVILTYAATLIAMFGAACAINGNLTAAAICLMVSGACDMFDGKVASTKKDRTIEEKHFGIQIDSLNDVVCFGVLPMIIGCCVGARSWWQIAILAVYVLCGLIRLAYFNVTEEIRQSNEPGHRKFYDGMPISAAGLLVPLVLDFRTLCGAAFPAVYCISMLIIGAAFVAKFKFPKFSMKESSIVLLLGVAVLVMLFVLN